MKIANILFKAAFFVGIIGGLTSLAGLFFVIVIMATGGDLPPPPRLVWIGMMMVFSAIFIAAIGDCVNKLSGGDFIP